MSRPLAWRLKNVSVYVGLAGYIAMIVTGDVIVGAWSKMIAELLRISYYRQSDAHDMARLSMFFITASLVAIALSFTS